MRRRSYEGKADVARLQRFNAESIAATGGCGYLHPGDIVHHLFYGGWYDYKSFVSRMTGEFSDALDMETIVRLLVSST